MKKLIDFFKRKRTYYFQGFIYLDKKGNPVQDITDRVKWLDKLSYTDKREEYAEQKGI